MGRKYGILIIGTLLVLGGIGAGILSYYYPFDFINDLLFKRKYELDPDVELETDIDYSLELWYPPFYRVIPGREDEINIEQIINETVKEYYPNLEIVTREISFQDIEKELQLALEEGVPPTLYLNLGSNSHLSNSYQVPVERYLDSKMRDNYQINWSLLDKKSRHLWTWPVLVQKQEWLANDPLEQFDELKRIEGLSSSLNLRGVELNFNYYDHQLLYQLLSLKGTTWIEFEEGKPIGGFYHDLGDILVWLEGLRDRDRIVNDDSMIISNYLKKDKQILAGGNPWLLKFLKDNREGRTIQLDNLVKIYGFNIFISDGKRDSKRVKAAMEVARLLSEKCGETFSQKLSLQQAFQPENLKSGTDTRMILDIPVEGQDYWKQKVWPAWIAYWEEGLSPARVMEKIISE